MATTIIRKQWDNDTYAIRKFPENPIILIKANKNVLYELALLDREPSMSTNNSRFSVKKSLTLFLTRAENSIWPANCANISLLYNSWMYKLCTLQLINSRTSHEKWLVKNVFFFRKCVTSRKSRISIQTITGTRGEYKPHFVIDIGAIACFSEKLNENK